MGNSHSRLTRLEQQLQLQNRQNKNFRNKLASYKNQVEHLVQQNQRSITDAAALGRDTLHAASETDSSITTTDCMFESVYAGNLPKAVNKSFLKKWRDAKDEQALQALLAKLFMAVESCHHILDTHAKGYYKAPCGKIDFTLSATDSAYWATLKAVMEIKFNLDNETKYHEAVGQALDRFWDACKAQPRRRRLMALLLGKNTVDIWIFNKDGDHKHTGRLNLEWLPNSPGFQVLMSFLHADDASLGYVPMPRPCNFEATPLSGGPVLVHDLDFIAGRPRTRPVYRAKYGNTDQTVVVKLCSERSMEREARILKAFKGMPGFPELLACGKLTAGVVQGSASHYLITAPLGQHAGDDNAAEDLLVLIHDVLKAMASLHRAGVLHRDISSHNVILAENNGVRRGILLDFHVAALMESRKATGITGKLDFRALRLHGATCGAQGGRSCHRAHISYDTDHTLASDLEGLFYTLLDVASDSRAILWRKCLGIERHIFHNKFTAMFSDSLWCKALSRCKPALQPTLDQLHSLIFKGGEKDYLSRPVTLQEFSEVLEANMGMFPGLQTHFQAANGVEEAAPADWWEDDVYDDGGSDGSGEEQEEEVEGDEEEDMAEEAAGEEEADGALGQSSAARLATLRGVGRSAGAMLAGFTQQLFGTGTTEQVEQGRSKKRRVGQ